MTAARRGKTFGSGIPQGVPHMDLNIHDQTFKVRGAMSGVRLLHVMDVMEGNADSAINTTRMVLQFLEDAFLTEDRERGMDYLENSDPPIELPMMMEIIQWLIEQYTGNPTQQPEPSTDGSPNDGSGSSESAPSAGVTYVSSTGTSSLPSGQLTQPVPSS